MRTATGRPARCGTLSRRYHEARHVRHTGSVCRLDGLPHDALAPARQDNASMGIAHRHRHSRADDALPRSPPQDTTHGGMRITARYILSLIVASVLVLMLCGCDTAGPDPYPTLPDGCQKEQDHCGGVDPYPEPESEVYPA